MKKTTISLMLFLLTACAGPNPNPGERTVDMGIEYRKLTQNDLDMLKRKAEAGQPWAELRMGVIHEIGNGVDKNLDEAEHWYTLATKHYEDDRWSNGSLIFAYGK